MQRSTSRAAFTLIELLVVITIIVVLLALLAPALDKAIYQAELVACAAQLDGISTGITQYTMSYQRRYPYKRPVHTHEMSWFLASMKSVVDPLRNNPQPTIYEYRHQVKDFVQYNNFLDPMAGNISMAPQDSDEDSAAYASYNLYDGLTFFQGVASTIPAGKGMNKLGDRLIWNDATGRTSIFNLIAADRITWDATSGYWVASHNDRSGSGTLLDRENTGIAAAGGKYLYSHYGATASGGEVFDFNYGRADGAVIRVGDIGIPPYQNPFSEGGSFESGLRPLPAGTEGYPPNDAGFTVQNWALEGG